MVRTFPFEYSECFSTTALTKIPDELIIRGNKSPELLLIIRLLSGTIKLEHIRSSRKFHQKDNYFSSDLKGYPRNWHNRFPDIMAEGYTVQQLALFVEKTKHKNKKFYKNILSELSYYFYYQDKGGHSSAFAFLYRALEHVSYAFPLIYISKADDFSRSYGYLKELMGDNKNSGELGFFKKFITTVYKDDPIIESSVDFEMALQTEEEQREMFLLLRGTCGSKFISDSTIEPRVLSIKYPEVGDFLITIRNRFFHFMNGGAKNIESSSIGDVDLFFSLVNRKFLYWLSTVFLAVISHSALEFERNMPQPA